MNVRQYAQDGYEFLMEHLTEFIEKHELGHIFDRSDDELYET